MELLVRPATPADPAPPLLYESAKPYYDAYAGGEAVARRLLDAVYGRRGHAASYEVCRVAEHEGEVVGVMAGFPVSHGDRLARRFVGLTFARLPPWGWARLVRHLQAAGSVSPRPPRGCWYVDALAVQEPWRRRGVAGALLEAAGEQAADAGLAGLALDTGLVNTGAQALYEACGFQRGEVRLAQGSRVERAIGGPGFVGYFKPVGR